MGPVAWDAVLRRARAAPLLSLSLSLAEGARMGRETLCRHMCTFAAGQWAVHVQLRKELAMSSYALGGEIERRSGRSWPHIHTHARAHTHTHTCMHACVFMKYLPVLALDSDTWTMPHGAAEHVSQMMFSVLKCKLDIHT
jgi:hypothetical protein